MSAFEERPPYPSYAAIVSAFAGLLATVGAVGRLLDRDPQCQTSLDFVVLAAASFKAARTLSHDEVTSFIRQPFVRGHAHEAARSPSKAAWSRRSASSSPARAASAPGPRRDWRLRRSWHRGSAGC